MRRTKEDAEQTRLSIIEAALALFSRNGYSNTTLAMIAAEAGFSRGPIYWHFRNKDDLYAAVLAYSQEPLEQLARDLEDVGEDPLAAIGDFAQRWLELLAGDAWFRQSFEILLNKTELTESLSATLRRERRLTRHIISALSARIAEAQRRGQIGASAEDPERHALVVYAALMGITQSWLFAPRLFNLGKEIPFLVGRLLRLLD